jgi:hypothetical protein
VNTYFSVLLQGVYIMTATDTWDLQKKLSASDALSGDEFGQAVGLDGETAVVGAPGCDDNGSRAGAAYVFVRTGNVWSEQAKLLASDGAAGDEFGSVVSISGDTVIVGASLDDDDGEASGSAYVFVRSGTVWTEEAKLTASDGAGNDEFGDSVCVLGDTLMIGSPGDDDGGAESGSVYPFTRSGTVWTQGSKGAAFDAEAGDSFGDSLAMSLIGSDLWVAIGASAEDENGLDAGCGYMAEFDGSWTFDTKRLAPNGKPGTNAVLPAPRSPKSSTTSPARSDSPSRAPAADVSSSLAVRISLTIRGDAPSSASSAPGWPR